MKHANWIGLLLALGILSPSHVWAETRIASDVYAWKDAPVVETENGSTRTLINGSATDFEFMNITATTFRPGKGEVEFTSADAEEMIVVKDGSLKITINGESKTVGRGSVAIVMPGDKRGYTNVSEGETTFYRLRYKSKNPVDTERGRKSGGSFVTNWNEVKFNSRSDGKGGTRSFFNKATAMGKRLELHSTLLEPNQNSHAPHHHRAEELVILLDADVEMYLGPGEKDGKLKKGSDGDVIYLVSNEYHAISNIGSKPALYIAFQFE